MPHLKMIVVKFGIGWEVNQGSFRGHQGSSEVKFEKKVLFVSIQYNQSHWSWHIWCHIKEKEKFPWYDTKIDLWIWFLIPILGQKWHFWALFNLLWVKFEFLKIVMFFTVAKPILESSWYFPKNWPQLLTCVMNNIEITKCKSHWPQNQKNCYFRSLVHFVV